MNELIEPVIERTAECNLERSNDWVTYIETWIGQAALNELRKQYLNRLDSLLK